MTKEDALFFLGRFRTKGINEKLYDALGVAIEALSSSEIPNSSDTIYRQDAIKFFTELWECIGTIGDREEWEDVCITTVNEIKSAQPEQQHGRIFQEIVVEYPSISTYPEHEGKPYFSIKYTENGQEFIGYGTYKPEVLSEYLKEYFMSPAQPEIIRCKYCTHSEHWYRDKRRCFLWSEEGISVFNDGFCNYAKRRQDE